MKLTRRNAACCNNRDDLANLRFIVRVSVFSEVYLELSRTPVITKHSCSVIVEKMLYFKNLLRKIDQKW